MEAAGQLRPVHLADSAPESAPAPKRRKLRKGTQSCWECKRRKARCTFAPANQDICEGCTRRGTDCVSQEVTDHPPPPGSNKHLVDRLGQVEAVVKQLLQASHGTGPHSRSQITSPARTVSSTAIRVGKDTSIVEAYDGVSKRLLEAWPSQEDMDIILAIPVETSQIIRAVICTRTSSTRTSLPSSATLLELPPPGSHPALVARSLLILASFLQGMPFSSAHHLEKLSTPWQELMSRAVKTAHNLVTCNDELIASLEGIECIMLEGLYENYAGNLRPSWLAARRSVAIAQMLGLNRGVKPKSLTASVIEPSDLWFRLVQFDRYLSLMLGLPQSSLEDIYASPDALEGCTPLDRFLRLCTVACGRLLQRDPSGVYDAGFNKEIDKLLQEASALMPAQWWVVPSITSDTDPVERIRETLRFNDQFMYYHLLLQLHFPNVLRPVSECGYIYHRMTAVTASREILSRMMSFRATRPARYYCRGSDLIAFFSSTALSLAHICDTPQDVTAQHGFHFLAHQRLSDRGLLEQTLAIMQELVDRNNDEIAVRVASVLDYLLAIEEDVASGGKYIVAFSSGALDHDELGYRVKMSDDGTTLKIYLPHFWAIKIRRQGSQGEKLPIGNSARGCDKNQLQRESRATEDIDISLVTTGQSQLSTFSAPNNAEGFGSKIIETGAQAPFEQEAYEADWALANLDFTFLDSFIEGTLEQDSSGSQGV
ncbi:Zn(II)2Cys6 transcription factor [Colletotrichum tofieldiae]|uniref:Zn(II)2Cys6 transcription factor n=1 Tax=Colletotrichum tofieldiae TaxID=708197 RepID=A0A166YLQ4_9PEZI|nr:Zn(II)2Cys6 transcription factor [Colletotrichum tofieldiae]